MMIDRERFRQGVIYQHFVESHRFFVRTIFSLADRTYFLMKPESLLTFKKESYINVGISKQIRGTPNKFRPFI